jgi:hypothetical protein
MDVYDGGWLDTLRKYLMQRRKAKIIRYQQPKTAGGGGGVGGGGASFTQGQYLQCCIINVEPGGYAVSVSPSNADGFLPTKAFLRPGAEVTAQFVCINNNRILVSARFSSKPET